ncbi:MAG: dockerin type I repeat-containing protein [Candidatus Omnitrophica bacterium]|nr:dockerin type I repeat-containing protein [Candidatus Omnitrophota bacterium]
MNRFWFMLWLLFFCLPPAWSDGVGQNMALGKTYTLSPAPNYALCTDAGDGVQLTDGKYVSGYFWVQPGTVGWYRTPVVITLDLGGVVPIDGVSFNTGAGTGAGVVWPAYIYMLVSDDNVTWYYAGDLVALDGRTSPPPASGSEIYRYKATGLLTHGRYVKLISSADPYLFVDEIEVLRGADTLLGTTLTGPAISDIPGFLSHQRAEDLLKRRLRTDLVAVTNEMNAANLPSVVTVPLQGELAAVNRLIPAARIDSLSKFTTVFPINDLHRRIFAVQAAVWQAMGFNGLVPWKAGRWDMLSPTQPPGQGVPDINVALMSNEFRADAVNLSNSSATSLDVAIMIEGLPGGTNPGYVAVAEVPFTDTQKSVPVAAALSPARQENGHYAVSIPAGLTRQIWLTFHPTVVTPGDYAGQFRLAAAGVAGVTVPIHFKVYPLQFPAKPSLHLGGWDYTDRDTYAVTPDNRDAFIQQLRDHFVDTPWGNSSVMPSGTYDSQGHMIRAPDSGYFKTWIDRWPGAPHYFVFSNENTVSFAGFPVGTPAFSQAVGEWITWWVRQLGQWNIKPQQLGLLLRDEPWSAAEANTIIQYASVIRAAQPEVVIFEDPTWTDPSQGPTQLFELSSILSPNLPLWIQNAKTYTNFFVQQRQAGRELWLYSCSGPRRLLDPYTYERLQAWFAWKYGVKGIEYWAFADTGSASSWNEYMVDAVVHDNFSPFFMDAKTVTTGKHMEGIREGVEDFEYLSMLRDKVEALEQKAISSAALTTARTLLTTAADRVIAARPSTVFDSWQQPKDRSTADQVRLEILESLTQLSALDCSGHCLSGDVSGDGLVTMEDAVMAAQFALNERSLTAQQQSNADISGDGKVTMYDAALIAKKALNLK